MSSEPCLPHPRPCQCPAGAPPGGVPGILTLILVPSLSGSRSGNSSTCRAKTQLLGAGAVAQRGASAWLAAEQGRSQVRAPEAPKSPRARQERFLRVEPNAFAGRRLPGPSGQAAGCRGRAKPLQSPPQPGCSARSLAWSRLGGRVRTGSGEPILGGLVGARGPERRMLGKVEPPRSFPGAGRGFGVGSPLLSPPGRVPRGDARGQVCKDALGLLGPPLWLVLVLPSAAARVPISDQVIRSS